MLNKGSQSLKTKYYVVPLETSRTGKSTEMWLLKVGVVIGGLEDDSWRVQEFLFRVIKVF